MLALVRANFHCLTTGGNLIFSPSMCLWTVLHGWQYI